MTFANKTMSVTPNTIKMNAKIVDWPFKTVENTINLIFDASNSNKQIQDCSTESHGDDNGNLRWTLLTVNGLSM